jgi:outer membrane protein
LRLLCSIRAWLAVVTAYVDVVRDQAVVRLRQTNVDVLTEQLRQTKDRFNVGGAPI